MTPDRRPPHVRGPMVRDHLLDVASELFAAHGTRAVGVDEVVRRSKTAKATLYRWFPTKDDLVLGVLQRRDDQFWARWDATAATAEDPCDELVAQLEWIRALALSPGYRGCVFVNTAAEFDDADHRIRSRCLRHEHELRRRLRDLATRLDVVGPERLADRLHIAVVGALATGGVFTDHGPARELPAVASALVAAARRSTAPCADGHTRRGGRA